MKKKKRKVPKKGGNGSKMHTGCLLTKTASILVRASPKKPNSYALEMVMSVGKC